MKNLAFEYIVTLVAVIGVGAAVWLNYSERRPPEGGYDDVMVTVPAEPPACPPHYTQFKTMCVKAPYDLQRVLEK